MASQVELSSRLVVQIDLRSHFIHLSYLGECTIDRNLMERSALRQESPKPIKNRQSNPQGNCQKLFATIMLLNYLVCQIQ